MLIVRISFLLCKYNGDLNDERGFQCLSFLNADLIGRRLN